MTTTDAAGHFLCSQWTDGPWLQKSYADKTSIATSISTKVHGNIVLTFGTSGTKTQVYTEIA